MGRPVSTPAYAVAVAFQEHGCENQDDFDWFVNDLQECIINRYPSACPIDKFIDREDRALAEDSFAYFGVSEYCGLAAIWAAEKGEYDPCDYNLAQHWLDQIVDGFEACFGNLRRVAVASNGETFYRRSP